MDAPDRTPPRTGKRLFAVFLLALLLFNYPLLAVFNRAGDVLGIPLLYAYLFGAWALVIGLLAAVVARAR